MESLTAQGLYAQLYDVYVSDWPGEVDFYKWLMAHAAVGIQNVLEIACGTGRITLQLAAEGFTMTGLDISPELLEVAQSKSCRVSNVKWIKGDMRSFEIGEMFDCIIVPGHSFQAMNTPDEQVKCLEQIKHHLVRDGLLVVHLDHQNIAWLADVLNRKEFACKKSRILTHPFTGLTFRQNCIWSFEPSSQAATVKIIWENIDEEGNVIGTWEKEAMRLHCVFRFEMEHLLKRVGFTIKAIYGDFFKSELSDKSEQMIWVASNADDTPNERRG